MYESFYKLSSRPFRLHPDPSFFFRGRSHRRAFAYLQLGLRFAEGFVIITGDVGSGKTTVVEVLLRQLNPDKLVAARIVATEFRSADLLPMVAAAFKLPNPAANPAAIVNQLEGFFRACRASGKQVLLVVDEAQNLTRTALEELRVLSDLNDNGAPLMQSFLLGQRELRKVLRSFHFEALRQRTTAAYHLTPLTRSETRAYIEHRLQTAGWSGERLFDEHAYLRIYKCTNGVPRRINRLCERLLTFGCLEQKQLITGPIVETVANDLLEEERAMTQEDVFDEVEPVIGDNTDQMFDPSEPEVTDLQEDNVLPGRFNTHQEPDFAQATDFEHTLAVRAPESPPVEAEDRIANVENQIKQLTEALTTHLAILQQERLLREAKSKKLRAAAIAKNMPPQVKGSAE